MFDLGPQVSKIWPMIGKAGSILYILIKYPLLFCIVLDLPSECSVMSVIYLTCPHPLANWRLHLTLSLHVCKLILLL